MKTPEWHHEREKADTLHGEGFNQFVLTSAVFSGGEPFAQASGLTPAHYISVLAPGAAPTYYISDAPRKVSSQESKKLKRQHKEKRKKRKQIKRSKKFNRQRA